MRWEDEGYVKLYSRDTPTWKAMAWQARALLPLLLRKVDKAGLLECGDLGKSAVGLMVELPEEVVLPGLESLEKLRVITWHGTTLEVPNFEQAQEARKSDILRKRESRQKAKDEVRAQAIKNTQGRSHGVTRGHEVSQPVTLQTSPAQPSPEEVVREQAPALAAEKQKAKTAQAQFVDWAKAKRDEIRKPPTDIPLKQHNWSEIAGALKQKGREQLEPAFLAYLRDDGWPAKLDPPWSVAVFCTPGQWPKYLSKSQRQPAAPQEPGCRLLGT